MASVLIVDDEDTFRRALKRYLELEIGWTVFEAADADQAKKLIPSLDLDGIVLDRRMPGESGSFVDTGDEVIRWLFDRQMLSELCVVMLTGYGELDSAQKALSMGAWQYLEKPLSPRDIYRFLAPGIAMKKCHKLRSLVAGAESTESVVKWIQDIIRQTLAPDFFHVILLLDDVCRDMTDGQEVSADRRFVREIRGGKAFLYADKRDKVRGLDPVLPDAGTLMAVRVVINQAETFGVVVMESRHEGAFDPKWQEVLGYLADLVGLSVTIRLALEAKVEAERQAGLCEIENLKLLRDQAEADERNLRLLFRELRHRLSTSIGTMYQHAEGIVADLDSDASRTATVKRAQVIQKHLKNFVAVMKELREVTKPQPIKLGGCPLVELAGDVLREKQPDFDRAKVRAELLAPDAEVIVQADRHQLEYCLQCILQNAIEAVQERRAGTRHVRRDEPDLDALVSSPVGPEERTPEPDVKVCVTKVREFGEIRVRDEGIGFDKEIEERLFTPLFTTKLNRDPDSSNDGMGLYTVKRLVEAMGGTIEPRSDGDCAGAEFTIRLRLAGEA